MPEKRHQGEAEQESLEKEATHVLEEARVVLPGVQSLFGFQLIAVYNQPFDRLLTHAEQCLHLGSLLLTALSIVTLMTPPAYHRQAEPHQISRRFLKLSSRLLTVAMFTLMLSIQIDGYLIARIILKDTLYAGVLTALLGTCYLLGWFVFPRVAKIRRNPS